MAFQLILLICIDLWTFTKGSDVLTPMGGSFVVGAVIDLDILERKVPKDSLKAKAQWIQRKKPLLPEAESTQLSQESLATSPLLALNMPPSKG